jgi:sugar lactone lactonase YvrE
MKKSYLLLLASVFTLGLSTASLAQTITLWAGNGTSGYMGDNGPATNAELKDTQGIGTDASGNVYIADPSNHVVRKITPAGIISTFAGSNTAVVLGDGGPATAALIVAPSGIAVDAAGNVYIGDISNRIRKVNTLGIISTIAGNGTAGSIGDNGPATAAEINQPEALAVDNKGNVYIGTVGDNKVRMVNSSGIISLVAGNGIAGATGDGSPATSAKLNFPSGLAVDTFGNVYIADMANSKIREVWKSNGNIYTFAGNGTPGSAGDNGAAGSAQLRAPQGVHLDIYGNLYVADGPNFTVRRISGSSSIITTVVGVGTSGSTGDNGPANAAKLNDPRDVAFDPSGNMFISDAGNSKVRKITPIPSVLVLNNSAPLCIAATNTLSDAISGGTWSSSNTIVATVGSSSGIVTAVTAGTATIQYKTLNDGASTIVLVNNCKLAVSHTATITNGLKVYPNPNDGTFTIMLTADNDEQATVTITNMVGVKVSEFKTYTNRPLEVRINQPTGLYFLNGYTSEGRWSEKISVTH